MESLRKGLKKGDLFEDGGRVFAVVEVNQDGSYMSELWCPKEEPEASEDAAGCVKANLDTEDLENWSVKELKKLDAEQGRATDAMCDFLILNISSLQLIPVNIIAYRSQYGSVNPAAIVGPAILATAISTGAAVLFIKLRQLCSNRKWKRIH